VQEHGSAHDFQVCSDRLSQALGQAVYAQDVLEAVDGIVIWIPGARRFYTGH
jgi:hypothetical protein